MTTKSADKTLCLSPLRLFRNDEPTTFQNGDVMVYDSECGTLWFGRSGSRLILGSPKENDKLYFPGLDVSHFLELGSLLSRLLGFRDPPPGGLKNSENGLWLWYFRSGS